MTRRVFGYILKKKREVAFLKIKPIGIPRVEYAQIFSAPDVKDKGAVRGGQFVISYVAEGKYEPSPEGEKVKRSIYDVFCSRAQKESTSPTELFHEHNTVCFSMELAEAETDDGLIMPSILEYSAPCEIHRLIDEIIRVYSNFPERKYALGGLVVQLLDEIDRRARKKDYDVNSKASLYEYRAIKYIYDNVDKPITQRDIARYLGITPEYFSAVFKSVRGMPPMQFVNRVKLSSIRMLMAKENLKLYEAAQRYGYSDANYVSKLFKKYYGINITQSLTKEEKQG